MSNSTSIIRNALPARILELFIILLITIPLYSNPGNNGLIRLEKNKFRIVFSDKEPEPLKIALEAFKKDFSRVMVAVPEVVEKSDKNNLIPEIVIVNRSSGALDIPLRKDKEPDGFESHRVYADMGSNKIYLVGNDTRGTIYAIYTFSERFLGVPPLHHWSSWVPERKNEVIVPGGCDIFFKSPQVRYRSILPGDQDFLNPWLKLSPENENIWLETVLRLKLNTVETYSTIKPGYKLTESAYLINNYGLIITSHHTSGLNTSFGTWEEYWEKVRNTEAPKLLLANESAIKDFFRYNAETVVRNGIENLWTVAFRGRTDQPFWSVFEDAPAGDKERAEVINRMLRIQLEIIKELTGNPNPYVRITFYDEVASLMSKGYLKPPEGENMIWTYVAARRDPYPYDDLVNFKSDKPVKLGYYMNFGFASTGAHIAPAEGPWKMEFNYRYINNKSPLYFSVVNVGNIREFVLELSANAKMLWDYNSYDSDDFMIDYCTQYFGSEHAGEIARLYKDFYNSYWQPKETIFPGMQRQFLFQDLRYARAFDHIYRVFYSSGEALNMNPLREIGYESVPGRTFRIDNEFNKSQNQVDAILYGMEKTIPRFELVAERCSKIKDQLDTDKRTFFNDNLRIYSYYMSHLSNTLYHYVYAYKHQGEKEVLIKNLELAHDEAVVAKEYLEEGEHGIFSTWYSNAEPMTRTFQIDSLIGNLIALKKQAMNMK
ncbi:MAG: glycosyl hydrolase 115 family protein [Bacteroidia bacterium]|nr:glycosyl hydrolase 115 family protein [Bacteroidia bacterium]